MKTLNRKLLTCLTVASMGIGMINPALAGGEDLKVAAVLNEGTQTELTLDQVNTIRPWAENSMTFMKQALQDIQGLSYLDKERLLLHAIKNVVLASAPKNSELLMRYVLNRGLKVHAILGANAVATDKHIIDVKVRVL